MGADSLAGDKLGGFNLTLQGGSRCGPADLRPRRMREIRQIVQPASDDAGWRGLYHVSTVRDPAEIQQKRRPSVDI